MIRTERLLLRPYEMTDVHALYEVFSNPDAMRYWSNLPHTDISQTEALVRETMNAEPARTQEFAIERDGHVIGKAGFWKMPEVGFLIHPDHWGQGIGTEAIGALIGYGFDALALRKITADVDPRNAASLGLLTKLGFRETGREANTIQLGDEWCDSVYLTLDAPNP